jgi:hypothetical protein
VKADVVQHLRPVEAVAKADMLQGDLAVDLRQCPARRLVGRLGRSVDDVAQAHDREAGLVEVLPELHDAQYWPADPARQHVESDELTDGKALVDDELADQLHGIAPILSNDSTLKLAPTQLANCSSQRRCIYGPTAMDLSVSTPCTRDSRRPTSFSFWSLCLKH